MATNKKAKDIFASPVASAIAVVIAVLWTIPTFGLLVSSIRPEKDINQSGWWTFFANPNITLDNYLQVLFAGSGTNPPLFQFFFNSFALTIPAVIFPITLALFAAYALAWFNFRGKDTIFFIIFGLQVVPLQLTLVPLLQLFAKGLVSNR
jgi:alpha-glucoside transport system permease protein